MLLIDLAQEGTMPVSGGSSDQTAAFLDAMRVVAEHDSFWRAKETRHG
jgi:hypothetical protein